MDRRITEGVATAISLNLPFYFNAKKNQIRFPVDASTVHQAGFPDVSAHHSELMRVIEETDLDIVKNAHHEIVLGMKQKR